MKSGARFPVGATLAMLAAFSLLCALGTWQVERLAWKNAILQALDKAYAMRIPPNLVSQDLEASARNRSLFIFGTIHGHFLPGEIAVRPRTHDGETGAHLYQPFSLANGGVILVNRGWVPEGWQGRVPDGSVSLTGLARKPDRKNPFTPPNRPGAGQWYAIDLKDINILLPESGNSLPYVFYAENARSAGEDYPLGFGRDWMPPNNHLQYAIFWFTMAFILAAIYALRFIRPFLKAKLIAQAPPVID